MTVFAFVAGAAFALAIRSFMRGMVDRDARIKILRCA